ncbi:hypothetical protein AK830_g11762 [Neonectria ditissima]|uniref:Uncharacterized protein n=1 Tax=Neonectria ditissima TaxID=78410 RepID=A0A0P7ALF8_9HYPO|nr:hypothetical protein AK830_g11762 [Neonectria ditissima]
MYSSNGTASERSTLAVTPSRARPRNHGTDDCFCTWGTNRPSHHPSITSIHHVHPWRKMEDRLAASFALAESAISSAASTNTPGQTPPCNALTHLTSHRRWAATSSHCRLHLAPGARWALGSRRATGHPLGYWTLLADKRWCMPGTTNRLPQHTTSVLLQPKPGPRRPRLSRADQARPDQADGRRPTNPQMNPRPKRPQTQAASQAYHHHLPMLLDSPRFSLQPSALIPRIDPLGP